MLQAVILAAGKSTRTYPLTLTKPKPLLRIVNKPILAHQLDQFVGLIREAIIIVGYKSHMIRDYFGYSYRGIELGYVEQREQLGTGHAAMQARPYIHDRFLLMNGDDLYARQDIEACLQYPYALLGKEVPDVRPFSELKIENGIVKDIIEKPSHPTGNLTSVGMFMLDRCLFEILETIPKSPRGEYELPDAIKRLTQIAPVHCQIVQHYWIPVGYPWHVLTANDFFLEHHFEELPLKGSIKDVVNIEGKIRLGENSVIQSGTYIRGNLCVGRNCTIGPNACITGNTSIGDNTHIGPGVVIKNSVIDRHCQIEPFCAISHSVLGEHVSVGTGTVTMSADITSKYVTSVIRGQVTESDREEFGVTLGSHVRLLPHVIAYPGVKVAPDTVVPPGTLIQQDLMS